MEKPLLAVEYLLELTYPLEIESVVESTLALL